MTRTRCLWLCLLLVWPGLAWGLTYSETFNTTQTPLSSTNWLQGGTNGLDWNNVNSNGTRAYGTMPDTVNYADDTALVKGSWGATQTASAVVSNSIPGGTGGFQEVEIRLRSSLSAHSNTGYEVLFSANPSSGYVQIVKWCGALGSFGLFDATTISPVTTGTTVSADISGTTTVTIHAKVGGTTVLTVTDTAGQDGTSPAEPAGCLAPITSGNPGIGFYNQSSGVSGSTFGFSSFTVTDGLSSAPPTATITAPTSATTFSTGLTPLTSLAGTATDDVGVTSVTWACPTCTPTSGTATCATCGASATAPSWSVASIGLASGDNVITVTANDADTQTGTDTLTVTYLPLGTAPAVLRLVR